MKTLGEQLAEEKAKAFELMMVEVNAVKRLDAELSDLQAKVESRTRERRYHEMEVNRLRREFREASDALQNYALGNPQGTWVEPGSY